MSRQLANPVPPLLLIVVIGWSSLLFLGFGLLASFNPVAVVAEASARCRWPARYS
jgi:hypothetical protein